MWDKRAEKWVTNFGKPQGKQISHQRMMAIAAHLRQKGLLKADDSVIDIGCGPGYYVAEFAKTACHVTGTDLSSQMVEYGICHAAEQGVTNVDFTVHDFKKVNLSDLSRMNWEKSFDLVFTSITPAFSGMAALEKMHRMSRGWCFNNAWVQKENNIQTYLRNALFPEKKDEEKMGLSVYALFNILWITDHRPEITYYDETSCDSMELNRQLAASLTETIVTPEEMTTELIDKVYMLLSRIAEGGIVKEINNATFAWLLWHV
jgi:SAM-dependent methyltransferase